MASGGGVGLDIDLCQIPLREADMEPFEIMVSESQERMLCVVAARARRRRCSRVRALGDRSPRTIGVRHRRRPVPGAAAREPCRATCRSAVLIDDCPLYDLEPEPPRRALYGAPEAVLTGDESPAETLLALLRSPNLASRRPVFEQYDPIVQSRTVRRPDEADAAVLVLAAGGSPAIAVSIDGNGRRVACDPRAARPRRCTSALPTSPASAPSRSA